MADGGAGADWHPDCYQRAAAFLTDPRGRLLVFDHVDVDAGTQVPAGGIHAAESAQLAALRELEEESGLRSAVVVRKLGESWARVRPGLVPAGLEERVQHAVHLALPHAPDRERWEWAERSGGDVVEHRFALRWLALDEAAQELVPDQAMWIEVLRQSLDHPT
ncbi:NUDIX domain-containing protein [Blastococcus sp. SYSU D01042]